MQTDKRILEVDGLRGVCALMVVTGHLIAWRYASYFSLPLVQLALGFARTGVMLFFVISGFVITNLVLAEKANGQFRLYDFFARRAIRIVPALFVYLVTVYALSKFGAVRQAADLIAIAASFSCNVIDDCGWFVGHTWSLAYEFQFYLVLPAILMFGNGSAVVLAIVLIFTVAASQTGLLPNDTISLSSLSAGCLIAHKYHHRSYDRPFLPVSMVFARRLLRARVPQSLGAISYSLYLWQQLFTASPFDYPLGAPSWSPLCLLPAALLSYLIVERALGRWLRRYLLNHVPD